MNLQGKNVLFLGSSVTYGAESGGVSFVEFMAQECGFSYVKEAVSGTTLADVNDKSYVSRLLKIDQNSKFDLFVCQLSTNDYYQKISLEDTKNAIIFIIDYVKSKFGCPIVFYTSPFFNSDDYAKTVQMLIEMQENYDFYILDLWNDKDMLSVSKEDYKIYMKDNVHPTLEVYRDWWTPKFINFFNKLFMCYLGLPNKTKED